MSASAPADGGREGGGRGGRGRAGSRAGGGPAGGGPERFGVAEPVDPDIDLHLARQRAETAGRRLWPVLAAVACGGALGALARHGLTLALPGGPYGTGSGAGSGFPWATFAANTTGCALIGVVMVLVSDLPPGPERLRAAARHPLARPFLGVGVLGGFTTFSTYAVGAARLLEEGSPGVAVAALAGTPAAALAAVAAGTWATRALVRRSARRPWRARAQRPPAGERP